jgi:uncharacterized protein
METLLGVSSRDETPQSAEWPFRETVSIEGAFARRVETRAASMQVGKVTLGSATLADPHMLSLLALDPALSDLDPKSMVFFDTETTGLGGAGTFAFLVGLAWFDERGALVFEQLLAREPCEEVAILTRVEEVVEGSSALVSFNGKSFDWPLLKARCVMNRRRVFSPRPHLDLLHVSRRLHKRRLKRFRLVDLEAEVLGWQRGADDIPGEEIGPLYSHFLRTGDRNALLPVALHNEWDVLTMVALVGLYGEPLGQMSGADLLGVAETLSRARDYEQAERAAEQAMNQGHAVEALALRARLNKSRGDKARALLDFECLSREVNDPWVRLELAKLCEHYTKDFERALSIVEGGTGEDEPAHFRRRTRLLRKTLGNKREE